MLTNRQSDCTPFIEFMLDIISKTIETPQVAPEVTPQVRKLLQALDGEMDRDHLQTAFGLRARKNFRHLYLAPALADGLIEMTIPSKPNNRLQKYRLPPKGQAVKAAANGSCKEATNRVDSFGLQGE